MRLAAYAGASTLLATGVIIKAFAERPNFYSAAVYLGQSSACRMILLNFLLFSAASTFFVLQRLLYGQLRPVETEQLWEKAWYAITETALAMTTFRDEVGGWFFIMFVALLAGKVWGWIAEGRVEIFEQQPPPNPRVFHARLISSLVVSNLFSVLMLRHCIHTLVEQPKPGMMVMFAFEFAVLTIISLSTLIRYALGVHEAFIVQRQTRIKLQERRAEIRAAREEATRQAEATGSPESAPNNIEREEDVDETDIDVPGWQDKGRWVLFLDLATDFVKLVLYLGFFTVLLLFSGIPIHMFRDLFITMRSFVKRINDYVKYRNATKDMHTRYPDATASDLQRDGTCIVCREEMHVWQPAQGGPHAGSNADERHRPKKLPCGHILHFSCLKSWLERQQVCPTCRRSVLSTPLANSTGVAPRQGQAVPAPPGNPNDARRDPTTQNGADPADRAQMRAEDVAGNEDRAQRRQNAVRGRTFNFPGFRLTFAAGNAQQVRDALEAMNQDNRVPRDRPNRAPRTQSQQRTAATPASVTSTNVDAISEQIQSIERQIMRQINDLQAAQDQLISVRALQGELARLRIARANNVSTRPTGATQLLSPPGQLPLRGPAFVFPSAHSTADTNPIVSGTSSIGSSQETLDAGSTGLPEGLVLPDGWSLIPLRSTTGSDTQQTHNWDVEDIVQPTADEHEASSAHNTGVASSSSNAALTVSEGRSQPPPDQHVDVPGATHGHRSTTDEGGIAGAEGSSRGAEDQAAPNWSETVEDHSGEASTDVKGKAATKERTLDDGNNEG